MDGRVVRSLSQPFRYAAVGMMVIIIVFFSCHSSVDYSERDIFKKFN